MTELRGYRRQKPEEEAAALHPPYASTVTRSPHQPLVVLPHSLSETTGPMYSGDTVAAGDNDLTRRHAGEPIGERIIVTGRLLDGEGHPVPDALIEIWQCNAAGRYHHEIDQHDAPLDPNFTGAGRMATDRDGHYRFITIKPGAYPWRNHPNAWRPAHIHFSVYGIGLAQRLITQMYFPGDPLLALDPIYNAIPDQHARERLVSAFDLETTEPEFALGYRWDMVLRGRDATPVTS